MVPPNRETRATSRNWSIRGAFSQERVYRRYVTLQIDAGRLAKAP